MKKLLPVLRYKGVQYIEFDKLKKYNVNAILLDVDNTLIDYTRKLSDAISEWVNEAKKRGFKLCILSNSNKVDKVKTVAETLGLDYIMCARKPMKSGFKKAIKLVDVPPQNIAMVGDQLFTDVLGANILNMVSIYVDPINKKEYWYTSWKRPIESLFLKKVR